MSMSPRIYSYPCTMRFHEIFLAITHYKNFKKSSNYKPIIFGMRLQRFFDLMAGESTEEIKLLSLQLVVYPMLHSTFNRSEQGQQEVSAASGETTDPDASTQIPETIELLGADVVEKFVTNVATQTLVEKLSKGVDMKEKPILKKILGN